MIPSGWKRVGEPRVYWEVEDEGGDGDHGVLVFVFDRESEAREKWRDRKEFRDDMRRSHAVMLRRVNRHRLERTEVVETRRVGRQQWDPDREVTDWDWGHGAVIGLHRENGREWDAWFNGDMISSHSTRKAAEQAVRKLLWDTGYRVVRAKEGT